MKNKAVKFSIVATLLPHVFCCGLPIVLSIVSLFVPEVAHHDAFVPGWLEPWIFVFSALVLGVSWVLVMRECKCSCEHCHGDGSHRVQKIILSTVTVIFIISILLHVIAHH